MILRARSANSSHVVTSTEESPSSEASPPSVSAFRVAIDSVDEMEDLNLGMPLPAEHSLNEAVQSPVFREVDTAVSMSASSRELSTSHAEEESNKLLSKQKYVALEDFGSEDPQRKKGVHTYEDVIDIQRRTDEERDTKRPRRDAILKQCHCRVRTPSI